MGDFWLIKARMSDFCVGETMESLAFFLRPLPRPLVLADRLRIGAYSGDFAITSVSRAGGKPLGLRAVSWSFISFQDRPVLCSSSSRGPLIGISRKHSLLPLLDSRILDQPLAYTRLIVFLQEAARSRVPVCCRAWQLRSCWCQRTRESDQFEADLMPSRQSRSCASLQALRNRRKTSLHAGLGYSRRVIQTPGVSKFERTLS